MAQRSVMHLDICEIEEKTQVWEGITEECLSGTIESLKSDKVIPFAEVLRILLAKESIHAYRLSDFL